ncbi:MAG TPA: amidohydrolase family protein [Silvibacterium sp.]|nr:amidohydrolase family protein [Silvibacterium sp.]
MNELRSAKVSGRFSPPYKFLLASLLIFASLLGPVIRAQTARSFDDPTTRILRDIDPELAQTIATIPAIDNHAHVVLPPPNDNTDRNFDALPVDNMEPETDPVAWRPDNPQLTAAWKALWGFDEPAPLDADGLKRLNAARSRVKSREGLNYDSWVLDQAGIGTVLANRVSMGPGLAKPRFQWVPYIDALLFPLDNSVLETTPDREQFFPLEDRLRSQYLKAVGLNTVPPTLAEYLARVVTPTLERQKSQGAIAEKFEVAYLRSFGFADTPRSDAERIYAKWVARNRPDPVEYKALQDFLFRYIASECGRLGMPIHFHTMSGGGGYFDIAGDNPLLLEPVFNDPGLRKTRFVMLHGGWPFVREAGSLLQKPNVYLDFSQEALIFPPRTMAVWLRVWLETYPDKVLFGTDGYPFSDSLGWEEGTWIASHNARQALGLALTGMLRDGEINRQRATEIARMVLRGTAAQLYGLK